jgi:hypothetical protein
MMPSIRLLGRCPANFRLSGALSALVLVGLLAQTTPSQAAPKAKESRELQAREAFATGRYQEAIELYGKLYAETMPTTRQTPPCPGFGFLGRPMAYPGRQRSR